MNDDDSAEVKLVDEIIAGEGGAAGDWRRYLGGSDGMGSVSSYPAGGFPAFPRDVLSSTPTSASLLLSMDMDPAALFEFSGTFPPSSSAAATTTAGGSALPAFHDFSCCVNPFDDAGHFLGAQQQGQQNKGGLFFAPPPGSDFNDDAGLSWDDDDEDEIDQSVDASSSMAISASMENAAGATPAGGSGPGGGGSGRGRKKGMPAKNLMAERRRRKKLNDRLYMLRSVVPKISKMDRASILGDAIEYLKELLQRINDLHNELESAPSSSLVGPTSSASFNPSTPTLQTFPGQVKEELFPGSFPSPTGQQATVEVRMREGHAVNIHMFCARRPGILLSTMTALDGLGLDIEQAVISCFNGFAMDVFRAEQCADGPGMVPEEIKAVLMHTAGLHNPM